MSATPTPDLTQTIERCRPADATPVSLDAPSLDSTAPVYLRRLKRELTRQGLFPAQVTLTACFDENCSLSTQSEADRIREYIQAASVLGAGSIRVECETVSDPAKVEPALAACAERAAREGLEFEFAGPISLD